MFDYILIAPLHLMMPDSLNGRFSKGYVRRLLIYSVIRLQLMVYEFCFWFLVDEVLLNMELNYFISTVFATEFDRR